MGLHGKRTRLISAVVPTGEIEPREEIPGVVDNGVNQFSPRIAARD